ncbi:MAG: hypothetical protein IPI45_04420 [Saprospiraceae bacterium]|nr:hypothetical protein [Saprospiraceae bacterium]MBK7737007.1 hypothetical protein [Saprospiraceae bacterium]MBK7914399.1 hypothetical protein [Saprospiraceae bacterium]
MLPNLISQPWYDFDKKHNRYAFFYDYGIGLEYLKMKYQFNASIGISERGTKVVNTVAPNSDSKYYIYYTFLEFPFVINYRIIDWLSLGFGLQPSIRIGESIEVDGETNSNKCLDIKVQTPIRINRRISLIASYTYGNFDKLIANRKDTYLHSVFAINLNFNFLTFKKQTK